MPGKLLRILVLAVGLFVVVIGARADYAGSILKESVKDGLELSNTPLKSKGYSPYAGKNFPTRVLWGDTHLHTRLSLDARAFGATLGPEDAYRFACGEEITSSHGEQVKLSRPPDWLDVPDHS